MRGMAPGDAMFAGHLSKAYMSFLSVNEVPGAMEIMVYSHLPALLVGRLCFT